MVETSGRLCAELGFPGVVTSGLRLTRLGTTSVASTLALLRADEAPAAVGRFVDVHVDRAS